MTDEERREIAQRIRDIAEEMAGTQGTWFSQADAIREAKTQLDELAEELEATAPQS